MRDIRNAKAMAQTLRAGLAAKDIKITVGQSLELIAEMFGVADWNTLAAAIRTEKLAPRVKASPSLATVAGNSIPLLSGTITAAQHRALGFASERKHEYATLEHLLLALIDDADTSAVTRACNADPGALAGKLTGYLDNGLKKQAIDDGANPKPSAAFQRVVKRAQLRGTELGCSTVTGANLLEAITIEILSPAARFLGEQGMTHQHVSSIVAQGSA